MESRDRDGEGGDGGVEMEGVELEGALQAMAHRAVEVAIRPKPVLRSSSPISSDLSLCLFVSFLSANQA